MYTDTVTDIQGLKMNGKTTTLSSGESVCIER